VERLVPSNGGVILFGKDNVREQYFPDARVGCALFQGENKAHFLDRLEIEGGILPALTEVPKFVRRNTRLASEIQTFVRKDIPAYSEVALREVLINAIAHADYSLTGMRIMIAIFSDRLEIQNPGILPFGMTIESFKAGASMVRNRTIAKVLRQLSLMEEWGSGYHRITTACAEGGYPLPEWEEIGPVLRVTFAPHPQTTTLSATQAQGGVPVNVPANVPVNVPVNERQQWFLDQLRQCVKCGPADIAAEWGVVLKTAKRDTADLQKKGLIIFVGPPKTGTYKLK
jgi:predicted HTH transcriptional regulator